MALDPQLLDILACPDTHHAPLTHDAEAQTLTCTECSRIFEIRDDIPVLLLDEARTPSAKEA
ncbi:Trm112 family protein [Paractinoplanes durhamensis]|uniref:Trm112 family protein n=1 Tax=Paractinoplanes durhamensis TaxID=113563 RepID=UPI00362E4FA7